MPTKTDFQVYKVEKTFTKPHTKYWMKSCFLPLPKAFTIIQTPMIGALGIIGLTLLGPRVPKMESRLRKF